jgi:hypothetical protein
MLFMVGTDVGTGTLSGTEMDIEITIGRKSACSILTPAVAIFGHNTGLEMVMWTGILCRNSADMVYKGAHPGGQKWRPRLKKIMEETK